MSEACKDEQRRQSRPVDLGGDGKTYRTVQDDIDTWRNISPETLEKAEAICEGKNNGKGFGWEQFVESGNWEDFVALPEVELVESLVKDFYQGNECPQRPTDIQHLFENLVKESDGIFNHIQAGRADRCIRPDGSSNIWDSWHRVLYAYLCGVTHIRVDTTYHSEDMSIEECRIAECILFEKKNGRCRMVGEKELFSKRVAIKKSTGKKAKTDADISLMEILEKCKISTCKKPGYVSIDNLTAIRETRKALKKHHVGSPDTADIQLAQSLNMITSIFHGESIMGSFLEGLTDFMIRFSDLEHVNHRNLKDFFSQNAKHSDWQKQTGYIQSNKNIKGRNKESISIRIASEWNLWMFAYKKELCGGKKPITSKVGMVKYIGRMPANYIEGVFLDIPKGKIQVQCSQCLYTWDQNITKKAA